MCTASVGAMSVGRWLINTDWHSLEGLLSRREANPVRLDADGSVVCGTFGECISVSGVYLAYRRGINDIAGF